MDAFDLTILGAGAAGMFCASVAGQRGARVALVDHAARIGEKIRISGGGRCNFTNLEGARLERYSGAQPRFARHALRAFPPQRFIELVRRHGIGFHEKHRGQLFCDDSSERIVSMLRREAETGGARWFAPCAVRSVAREAGGFVVHTDGGDLRSRALVVATGGLSIPKIGATDLGYRIARQFGLRVVEPRPALVPLTFSAHDWQPFGELSGIGLEVLIRAPANPLAPQFREDLLFTHRGLSGPAVLQISSFWRPRDPIEVDLAPGHRLDEEWIASARGASKQTLAGLLAEAVPRRLAQRWLQRLAEAQPGVRPEAQPEARLDVRPEQRVAEAGHRVLRALANSLQHWSLTPEGTEGFRKAEVTAGGVATEALDPRTMQARGVPGLHFVGEVVDVTGWLGGYNFQWAWASAHAAAMALTP